MTKFLVCALACFFFCQSLFFLCSVTLSVFYMFNTVVFNMVIKQTNKVQHLHWSFYITTKENYLTDNSFDTWALFFLLFCGDPMKHFCLILGKFLIHSWWCSCLYLIGCYSLWLQYKDAVVSLTPFPIKLVLIVCRNSTLLFSKQNQWERRVNLKHLGQLRFPSWVFGPL